MQVSRLQTTHRLGPVFLDAARERRQHEHRLEVLLVQDLHAGVPVLVLGMIAQPLRVALTGKTTSPGVFDVIEVLGRDECLARLADQMTEAR